MKPKYQFFIFFIMILIHACKPASNTLYEFNPKTLEVREITLSEIAEDVTYIPLANIIPLNKIFTIMFIKDAIYLNSKDIGILKFNREGKYIGKIGSVGRGYGEYLIYTRFCIDDRSERAYVADSKEAIKVYSKAGQYLRNFSLTGFGDVIENIGFYDSRIFVQYGTQFRNSDYEWIICDTLGKVIKKQKRHLPEFTANWGGSQSIYKFGDRLSYYNSFTDTVFSILPNLTEIPSFIIGTGEYRYPRSNLSLEQFMSGKYLDLTKIFETNRFFVIVYNYNKKHYLALIDKHNQESFLIPFEYSESGGFPISGIVNDLDGGSWFFPVSYLTEEGSEYMVGIQYPYQIKVRVASDEFKNSTPKYPEKKKELKKLTDNLKETDNPVLMVIRLKK